jgi:hypothetical protein
MMTALADLGGFQTTSGLTNPQLLQIADITGDQQVTNTDLQGLIDLLASGSDIGSLAAVPEPSSIVLAIFLFAAILGGQLNRSTAKVRRRLTIT